MKLQIIECKTELTINEVSNVISSIKPFDKYKLIDKNFYNKTFEAVYYQEHFRPEKIVDSDGKENIINLVHYINQKFIFTEIDSRLFLIVYEPSRYSKYLHEYLNKIFGLKISYSTKKLMLNEIITNLSKFDNLVILKARFNEISLNKHSKCSLEITSTKNALVDFANTFGQVYYDLAKIKVSFFYKTKITLEIYKNGNVIISKNLLNERDFIVFFIQQVLYN